MKRSLTLLLASMLLVFGLTACGGDDKQQDQANNQNDSAVVGGDTAGNGADNGGNGSSNNGDSSNGGSNNGGSSNGSSSNGSSSNGGSSNGSSNNGSSNNGTNGSLLEDTKDAVDRGMNDLKDAVDGADEGTSNRSAGGVTYEQMLRNGRVHDRDGDLTDLENPVTPGSDTF